MSKNRGFQARLEAPRKRWSSPPRELPRVIRPGVPVSCPMCSHYPVRVTKNGLLPHLDCEASGRRVALDDGGNLVLSD